MALSIEDIAREAGVSREALDNVVDTMVADGFLVQVLAPLCPNCHSFMGEFKDADELPDYLSCPQCGEQYHITETDIRLSYSVVKKD